LFEFCCGNLTLQELVSLCTPSGVFSLHKTFYTLNQNQQIGAFQSVEKNLIMWIKSIHFLYRDCCPEIENNWIYSHKRKPMLDMFPSTSVDMFPITIGVEIAVLIAINSTQNTLRV
jgi:hypothetical protein